MLKNLYQHANLPATNKQCQMLSQKPFSNTTQSVTETFTDDMTLFLIFLIILHFSNASRCSNEEDNIMCKGVVLDFVHGIRILSVSNKNITELQPGSLNELKNFTRIDLSNNSLTVIQNGVFSNMDFVTVDLAFNQIDVIENAAFDDMTELRYLKLDFNRITTWDAAWFKNNRNLHQISFRGNFIKVVPSKAFQNIRWIHNYDLFIRVVTVVDLSNNQIESLYSDAFGDEREVGRLNFANNTISSVPRELFADVEYVEELDFSYNKLECDTVFFLLNLRSLDIVNMKFQNVNSIY